MRRLLKVILFLSLPTALISQNFTTVIATNFQRAGAPLASGKLCFQATDDNDTNIAFRVGGGGQEVIEPYCTAILNGGVVGTFLVANPATTAPANISYRVQVFGFKSGALLTYTGVQFTGAIFNLDNYVPSANLPFGTSADNLAVQNLTVTGSCVGCITQGDFSFNLENPTVLDAGKFQHKVSFAGQFTRISCSTDVATVGINFEVRTEATPNTTGTSIFAAPLICTTTTASTTSFAVATFSANSPLALVISSNLGASLVRVHVHVSPQ